MTQPTFATLGPVKVIGTEGQDPAKLEKFRELALSLMARHDLQDWKFELDQARRRAGQCRYGKDGAPGTLSFSAPLMSAWTPAQQLDTVLHEIAHARKPGHGHDSAWQLECIRIGADPTRTWGHKGEEELEARWTGTCPNGHQISRERKPSKPFSCARCSHWFDPRFLFTWTRNY